MKTIKQLEKEIEENQTLTDEELQVLYQNVFQKLSRTEYDELEDDFNQWQRRAKLKQTKEIIKMIEEFEFKCCDTLEECGKMRELKEELINKIKGK